MKNRVAVSLSVLLAMGSVSAFAGDGPGCGLGQRVWQGKSGLFAHTSAATTNGIFANQLFGITFGTLGCSPSAVVENEYEKKQFVAANIDELARDTAKGNGAHLVSLAGLMGISAEDQAAFFAVSQANYDKIFTSDMHDYRDVLAGFDNVLRADAHLSRYVRKQNV